MHSTTLTAVPIGTLSTSFYFKFIAMYRKEKGRGCISITQKRLSVCGTDSGKACLRASHEYYLKKKKKKKAGGGGGMHIMRKESNTKL